MRSTASILVGTFVLLAANWGQAIGIAPGGTVAESFAIGTSATAALPPDWRVDRPTAVRTVGAYAAASTNTGFRAGNSMSSTAQNGIYNYGAGAAEAATDRAVGFVSSASDTKSGNLYVRLDNTGGVAIPSLTISYNVEKYRRGSNPAGFSIQLYYSTDGSTWTSAGSDFLTSFAADANNDGYASAPGVVVAVAHRQLAREIPAARSLYLAWNYSVTSGTTTSNAQGLGIDDVTIVAAASPTLAPPTGLTAAAVGANGFTAAWGSVATAVGYRLSLWTIAGAPPNEQFVPVPGWSGVWVDGASRAVTGLTPKTTYYWSVRAVAGAVESDSSELAEVTLLNAVAAARVPGIARIARRPGGGVEVTCVSESGATYALEWRPRLMGAPDWREVAGSTRAGTGGVLTLTDTTDRGTQAFYRVRVTVP